jgi:hypothetical protein
VSVVVQAFMSSHAFPSVAGGLLQAPLDRSHVPAAWQMSDAVQVTAVPAQAPAWQVSPVVHLLLSLQLVPSAASGLVHWPVVGSQVPATWQASSAVQTTETPAVQTPAMQDAPHPAPQAVPFALFGLLHAPVVGLQTASWQASAPAQAFGFPPAQTPAWQVSVCVHMSPSSQPVPSVLIGFEQAPVDGSQVPTMWHWFSAVQLTGLPPVQTPDWHVSLCVHRLPSLQVVPSALAGLEHAPVDGLQAPATWH